MLEGTKTLAAVGLDRITFNPRVMGARPVSAATGLQWHRCSSSSRVA
jgi:hypothetical protein